MMNFNWGTHHVKWTVASMIWGACCLRGNLQAMTVTVGARSCFSNPGDQKNVASSMKEKHTRVNALNTLLIVPDDLNK